MHDIMVRPLPAGCRLTAIYDVSIFFLPFPSVFLSSFRVTLMIFLGFLVAIEWTGYSRVILDLRWVRRPATARFFFFFLTRSQSINRQICPTLCVPPLLLFEPLVSLTHPLLFPLHPPPPTLPTVLNRRKNQRTQPRRRSRPRPPQRSNVVRTRRHGRRLLEPDEDREDGDGRGREEGGGAEQADEDEFGGLCASVFFLSFLT